MANEHTLVFETHPPIPMTVADGTGIEKGTILQLFSPFTAVAVSASNQHVAGVAAREKIASNGQTKLAIYRGGIFKCTASGTVTKGDTLGTDHTGNKLASNVNTAALSGATIVGIALESVTDGQTMLYELRPMAQTKQVA